MTEANSKKLNPADLTPPVPVVSRLLLFFYFVTWFSLLGDGWSAIATTTNDDYFYLVPAGLYGLHLLIFFRIEYKAKQGLSLRWDTPVWGNRNKGYSGQQLIFLLISLILIFWMTQLNVNFVWMYFALFSQTMGMVSWKWGLPLGLFEIVIVLEQTNILYNNKFENGAFWSFVIGGPFALLYMLIIVLLIRSRLESERLVRELKATKLRLEEASIKEKEVAVLRERDRMAREMHDVLGHALVLVAVKIEAAQRLQAVDPTRAACELEATKELVRQSMTDLRASLAELRSPALEADGQPMVEALKSWAEATARENCLFIEYNSEAGIALLPLPIQDALWRVGREAIINVVKHARAQKIELNLFCKDSQIFLSVGDDGVGIPHLAEGKARLEVEGHYGIRGMRERLETLGGQLTIKPGRNAQGTLVLVSVPLPSAQDKETPPNRLRKRLSPVKNWLSIKG